MDKSNYCNKQNQVIFDKVDSLLKKVIKKLDIQCDANVYTMFKTQYNKKHSFSSKIGVDNKLLLGLNCTLWEHWAKLEGNVFC